MKISLDLIKKLREETQAGVSDCHKALTDAGGDYAKAKKLIAERGLEKASKKQDKATAIGVIESYVHSTGKVGVLVEIRCETDFVARNEEFKKLAHEVAMQIAAMNPKDVTELLKTEYIRDASITIDQLIKTTISKVGENIAITRFTRMQEGKE
jgi:elongation factor Ts